MTTCVSPSGGGRQPLLGMSMAELSEVAESLSMPSYAAGQMARWLYWRHVDSIDGMTDLSAASRRLLKEKFTVGRAVPAKCQRSEDGTVKYLFPVNGGKYVETVYIPDGERATLCVSSQVGCRMRCLFCQTGRQGFEGNLSAADILNQIFSLPERDTLTNIVFMGQGEPLDNIDNVLRATEVITSGYGMKWSPKRVTVSSVGVRGKLKRFLDESGCHLAISMHTPFASERARLMPAEKGMPLADIIRLLRSYDFTHQRRLSFEYIVFAGLNDSAAHAKEVVRMLRGMECRVNLIRFHEIPGVDLRPATATDMLRMRDYLTGHGVFATVRASRGQDIAAACGLLTTKERNITTKDDIT